MRLRVSRGACIGALLLLLPVSARADRTVATAAAIVPGVVVHGTGHFVAKEPAIGRKLLAVEAIGLGMTFTSLAAVAATGASRRVVAPFAVMAVVGVGLFGLSAISDIYGVVAPRDGFGQPVRAPWLETSVGVRAIHDPQFHYGALVDQSIDARISRVHLRGESMTAPTGGYHRFAGLAGVRLTRARDGSFLDLETVLSHRAYRFDGFSATTVEVRASSLLDLHRFARTLRGSFAELQLGGAIASYRYTYGGTEGDDLLLLRLGYGLYLGKRSEVSIYYDHRRDSIVGGGLVPGIGAGYVGFCGVDGRWFFDPQWGVAFDARMGGAYLAGASLVFRQGASSW